MSWESGSRSYIPPKAWEFGVQKSTDRWQMSQLKQRERRIHSSPPFGPSVDRIRPPHWGGQYTLLSSPIQMLISFENTLTDSPRNNVVPPIWAPLRPIKLTHKINCNSNDLFGGRILFNMFPLLALQVPCLLCSPLDPQYIQIHWKQMGSTQ